MGVRVRVALRLICAISILSAAGWAQLARYDGFVAPAGYANGPANVAVCSATGSGGPPCSPQALIYSDVTGKYQISQPFSADINGRYYFYAAPGTYAVQTYGTGYTTTLVTVTIGAAGSSQNITNLNGGMYSAIANGLKCDGATDDTAALIALDQAVYNAGGGTIVFPQATCLISSASIVMPTDGGNIPRTKAIRWTGQNPSMMSTPPTNGTYAPVGGSILNLTFNANTTAKIDARGAGYFEIDHLTLEDTGSDCAPFISTTNTVLHFHDNAVFGTTISNGTTFSCNDAILLGNASGTISGAFNAPFQGYGTVIRDNWFDQVRRAIYGQTFANAIQIVDNTIWNQSGFATGGAIEFSGCGPSCPGQSGGSDTGNVIDGNLIETIFYKYGIHFSGYVQQNYLPGNSCYDSQATPFVTCVQLDTHADWNLVWPGWNQCCSTGPFFTDVDGQSTLIDPRFNTGDFSIWPNVNKWTNADNEFRNPATGNVTINSPWWTDGDNNIFDLLVSPSASQPQWTLRYVPGGVPETMITFQKPGTGQSLMVSTAHDLYIAAGVGNTLHFGDNGNNNHWALDGSGNLAPQSTSEHITQSSTNTFAGTCAMSAGTTCTATLGHSFTSSPVCVATAQSTAASPPAGACLVSAGSTTVTITASASNSLTWGYVVIGNPN